ncbi:MAG: hypothetical protein P4L62_00100 [Candidatus Pacebacteria bacterium]|nr:hypothetical protein [Candidatus Paceibacterota bacterium]MDR3582750.1 hypothetical protein [Candidatus Paceibacterota bacterium]
MIKKSLLVASVAITAFLGVQTSVAVAAKSPTPRITEAAGTSYSTGTPYQLRSVRVHFQISPVVNGQIIKARYILKGKKYTDIKYNPPKAANRSGTVNTACSSAGSAIDLSSIPDNSITQNKSFLYSVKVRIKQPGKSWSGWSGNFLF